MIGFPSGFASRIASYLAPSAKVAINRGQVWLSDGERNEPTSIISLYDSRMNFKTSNEIRRLSKEFCTAVTEYLMFDIIRIIMDHIPLYLRSKRIIKNDKKNESTNVNINKLREFLMRYPRVGGLSLRLRSKNLSIDTINDICTILENNLVSTSSLYLQGTMEYCSTLGSTDGDLPDDITQRLIRALYGREPRSLRSCKFHSITASAIDLRELSINFESLSILNCKVDRLLMSHIVNLEWFEYVEAGLADSLLFKSEYDSNNDSLSDIAYYEGYPFIKIMSREDDIGVLRAKRLVLIGTMSSIKLLKNIQNCVCDVQDLSIIDYHPPNIIGNGHKKPLLDLTTWEKTIKRLTICKRLVAQSDYEEQLSSDLQLNNQYVNISSIRSKLEHIKII